MSKLLVVDDEPTICWGLTRLGESIGHEVRTASSAEQALDAIEVDRPDVIVLDVRLPGMDGLSALERFQERCAQVPVVVITAYGDLATAVTAVRNGAFEYIVKPFGLDQMEHVLKRALETARQPAVSDVEPVEHVGGFVGRTLAMQEVFKRIALSAGSDTAVLLCGESGTGKELAARAIHGYSLRSEGPFVAVNVASLSPTLAESELFGHVRGAFTGAEDARIGLLAQADGGTLFLDEVADIPLPIQVKLLRALELGEVLPVGANKVVPTNFRVISATHQSLTDNVRQGKFRHDLYFRLCGFQIDMPPLRDRSEDIPELAEHFLRRAVQNGSSHRTKFAPATLADLARRPWYGNVRELRHAVEHAVLLARGGVVQPEHLPPSAARSLVAHETLADGESGEIVVQVKAWAESKFREPGDHEQLHQRLLEVVEPPLFEAALAAHHGSCAAAARSLGLHRTTLKKKLDQLGVTDADSER